VIWYPFVFKRKVGNLPFGRSNKGANATNFLFVWYEEGIHKSILEQEKAEALLTLVFLTLSVLVGVCLYWWLFWVPLLIYPLPMVMHIIPLSVYIRRFVELRTHAIELKAWKSMETPTENDFNYRIYRESISMANHSPYNLKLPWYEIERKLRGLLKLD